MKTSITPEELLEIENFLENGNAEFLKGTAGKSLTALFYAVQRKTNEVASRLATENYSLTRKVEMHKQREDHLVQEGVFSELDFDSVDIARCLLYCLRQNKAYKLTSGKLLLVLYEAYGSWLGSKRQRLFDEHPVCGQYGPMFWKVFKRVDVRVSVPYDAYKLIAEKNAGVVKFLSNVAAKYADRDEKSLAGDILRSKPYKEHVAARNKGKWNGEIPDNEIYLWKNGQL